MLRDRGGIAVNTAALGSRCGEDLSYKIKERFPVWSGTVATAGDVTFYGTMDSWFKAVHARTGDVLWQTQSRLGNSRAADHLQRTGRESNTWQCWPE